MAQALSTSIRTAVRVLHEQASLRELASVLGVSHQTLFKLVQGRPLRPSTLRHVAEGLEGSRDAVAFDQLHEALGTLLRDVPASQRRHIEQCLRPVVEAAFRSARQPIPEWVNWLSDGRRSVQPAKLSVQALLKRAQAGSKVGARP